MGLRLLRGRLAAFVPPQPKHQQAPVRTPPRRQRITPDPRMAVRIGLDLHVSIVQAIAQAGYSPHCPQGEQPQNGRWKEDGKAPTSTTAGLIRGQLCAFTTQFV
jgi:hypothetical protein